MRDCRKHTGHNPASAMKETQCSHFCLQSNQLRRRSRRWHVLKVLWAKTAEMMANAYGALLAQDVPAKQVTLKKLRKMVQGVAFYTRAGFATG
eukprot:SAG11_NODE_610_length_8221_cov_4.801650_4_plen_93_part_00